MGTFRKALPYQNNILGISLLKPLKALPYVLKMKLTLVKISAWRQKE